MFKNKITLTALCVFAILNVSFLNPDYLEWSHERSLKFEDFKANIPKTASTNSAVNLSTVLSYQTKQTKGEVPHITVLNLIDRNTSWIKVKKTEILELQQIKFDYAELYARKMRKEMKTMNKNGVKEKQKYIDVISKISKQLDKRQRLNNVLLEDQPHLIKIMKKDISDSLNLYKEYKK